MRPTVMGDQLGSGNTASRIVFIRHGQTDFNVERRFQGIINHPLNDYGRQQAHHAGSVLGARLVAPSRQVGISAHPGQGASVRMVCSPLDRARETAEILRTECVSRGVECAEISIDQRLIERSYGVFEGRTLDEVASTHPQELAQWRRTGESAEAGIEPSDAVGHRVKAGVLEAVVHAQAHQTVIVVSHGSAITRGIVTFLGLDPLTFDGLRGLDNCHWSELIHTGGGGSGASGEASWRLTAHNIGYREDVLGA
ncbi:histidine phosphatase family protein [Schaalia sp. ZJ1691]|uniref:histidine phosphatase family protein n=1 Tax=Schaalia sp. ZJ1691 TaxID=2709404 RepID=UPI001F1571B2|nr:histidine phosphatase family protein [Schaalia sp. ZJ1691]